MSLREQDDDYDYIIAQLGPKHRLIVCSDDIQWILQEFHSKRWRSVKYCTSREGVLRWASGLPNAEVLVNLPERFKSGSDKPGEAAVEG